MVELEELIDNFNKMLVHIDTYNRERIVFAAGIAHELRTPLTILKGRLHGLEDGVIEPSADEATRLLRQADHLLLLVNDLATLAHAHAEVIEPKPQSNSISIDNCYMRSSSGMA